MLVEPLRTPSFFADTSSMPFSMTCMSTSQAFQAASSCLVIAVAVDLLFQKTAVNIRGAIWAILGFEAGLLAKKITSLYTRLHIFEKNALEWTERFPYAYAAAMTTALCTSSWFPIIGIPIATSLGFLSGYMFQITRTY